MGYESGVHYHASQITLVSYVVKCVLNRLACMTYVFHCSEKQRLHYNVFEV